MPWRVLQLGSIPNLRLLRHQSQVLFTMAKKVAAKKMVAKRRSRKQTFNSYIFKIMKQVHPYFLYDTSFSFRVFWFS